MLTRPREGRRSRRTLSSREECSRFGGRGARAAADAPRAAPGLCCPAPSGSSPVDVRPWARAHVYTHTCARRHTLTCMCAQADTRTHKHIIDAHARPHIRGHARTRHTCARHTRAHTHVCTHRVPGQAGQGPREARGPRTAQGPRPGSRAPVSTRPSPAAAEWVPRPQMSARQSPARLPAGRASRERCERGPRRLPSRRNEDSSKPGNRGTSGGVPSRLSPA